MTEMLNWVAPAATIIAAMMTAANLGPRITGWGFAIFLLASLAWTTIGIFNGPPSLIYANTFLIVVNGVGVWRWLGRQAKYEDGSAQAAQQSARADVPTLFSFAEIIGSDVMDRRGKAIGTVVDIMGQTAGKQIAYIVVREGGIVGVGERLHAVAGSKINLSDGVLHMSLDHDQLSAMEALSPGNWPTTLDEVEATPQKIS